MINLLEQTKLDRVNAAVSAGQTTVNSDVVDMLGFDSCLFAVLLGDVTDTSVVKLTIQHGDQSNGSDMADTTISTSYTAGASDADNNMLAAEINRPLKRYVRAKVERNTANAEVDGVLAQLANPDEAPTSHADDLLSDAFDYSPASA